MLKKIFFILSSIFIFAGCSAGVFTRLDQLDKFGGKSIDVVEKVRGKAQFVKRDNKRNRDVYWFPVYEKNKEGKMVHTGCFDKMSVNNDKKVVMLAYGCDEKAEKIAFQGDIQKQDIYNTTEKELVDLVTDGKLQEVDKILSEGILSPHTRRAEGVTSDLMNSFKVLTTLAVSPGAMAEQFKSLEFMENKLELIHIASIHGHNDIVKLLVEKYKVPFNQTPEGDSKNGYDQLRKITPFTLTSLDNHELLLYLLKKGANANEYRFKADAKYDVLGLDREIKWGTNVNQKHLYYILYRIIKNDKFNSTKKELFDYLIKKYNVNLDRYYLDQKYPDTNILITASLNGNLNLVKHMLELGANPNAKDASRGKEFNVLNVALYSGKNDGIKIAKVLMKKGAKVDIETLFQASMGGNLKSVKFVVDELLKNNINTNIKKVAPNLLIYASASDNASFQRDKGVGLIKYLVTEQGYDVNYKFKDSGGMTPLMYAIDKSNNKIMDYLIKNGADVNAKFDSDVKNNTTLMYAAAVNNLYAVKKLVEEYNVDINRKNSIGYTALDFAKKKDAKEVIEYLEKL